MKTVALLINGIVVFVIGAELVMILFGKINPDQLLLSSGAAGLLLVVSLKLIKDALLRLYGLSAGSETAIKNEINILEAMNSHVNIKTRLQKYIEGGPPDEQLNPDVVCRDDSCKLGQWLKGPALQHFDGNERFNSLCSKHAELHTTAAEIVKKVQANDVVAARDLLSNKYRKASHEVSLALGELNKIIPSA